jgi:uncharacterized protein (DUF2252 family)
MTNPSKQPASMNAADKEQLGKSKRKQSPRRSHGDWAPETDRADPLVLLQEQDQGRLPHLLPIKYGRMMESPFAFLRGSAVIMAADLASTPVSGLDVVLCGDAHLSNFGLFATPERKLVFDVNDFDEAYPGPWEWDLKRLATSAVVAGRNNGFDQKTCRQLARIAVGAYRKAMQEFASMSIMDRWYAQVDASSVVELFAEHDADDAKRAGKAVKKARTRTSAHSLAKLTEEVGGRRQFRNDPPLLVRLAELATDAEKKAAKEQGDVLKYWTAYVSSLQEAFNTTGVSSRT